MSELENEKTQETPSIDTGDAGGEKMYYSAFFTDDADYYHRKRETIKTHGIAFNPYAFFLGFLWFAYRKMYIELFAFVGIIFVFDSLPLYLLNIDNPLLDRLLNLAWGSLFGFTASTLYVRKAGRAIERAKTIHGSTEAQLNYLKKVGGVSLFSAVSVGFIIGLIFVVSLAMSGAGNSYHH